MRFTSFLTISAAVCFVAVSASHGVTQTIGNSPAHSNSKRSEAVRVVEPQAIPAPAEKRTYMEKRARQIMREKLAKRLDPSVIVMSTEQAANKIISTAETTANTDLQQLKPPGKPATLPPTTATTPSTPPATKPNDTGSNAAPPAGKGQSEAGETSTTQPGSGTDDN